MLQADEAIVGEGREFAIHVIEGNRAIHGVQLNGSGFRRRISKYTVQSSSSAGPLVDTLPFSVDMVICERMRSAASPDPAAALHAVTEYVSLSQPTTCTPPFSCGCTCRTAASDFVSVLSSDRTAASRSSNWMRSSEQSVIGYLWPPERLT